MANKKPPIDLLSSEDDDASPADVLEPTADNPFAASSDDPFASTGDTSLPTSFGNPFGDPFGQAPEQAGDFEVDLSGVEERTVITAGVYVLECQGISRKTSQNGNPMWEWTYRIVGGDFDGRTLKNFTALTPQALWKVNEAVEAHGVKMENGKAKFRPEDVVGTCVIGQVVVGDYEGRPQSRLQALKAHPNGAGLRRKPVNVP